MGCSSCGTGGDKAPGCKSNGGCSSGGCNRMNVYDWLTNLPISDAEISCRVVEVSFNNGSRKDYFRNHTVQIFDKGDMVSVEGVSGFDVGMINLTGEVVRLQLKKKGINELDPEMRKVLRRSVDRDIDVMKQNKAREREAVIRARAITKQLNLDMKISEVEFQADGRKATFFYIADDRVDFRELIKIYAKEFKVKVEMRQIGARQEAGKVGGIGSCGRELCCSTWLTDFKSVNTTAARYQNLSINQSKLSGQCGRLKCCLNYELDTYLDALQNFPDNADTLQVAKGTAILIKKDIFRNLMWYILPDSSKQYPLSIERVKKIKFENSKNIVPTDLEPVEVTSNKPKELEPEFVDLVGQISLRSLDKAERKKRANSPQPQQRRNNPANPNNPNNPNNPQQRPPQNRPPQQRPPGNNIERRPKK
jgi:cell fate regulator YaaT (PSP1 superfamily)